jgi:glycosyltransferase involved in cell wall biosynthesis
MLIPHLGGGGAEQVIALLAKCLSSKKYEIHVGLITGTVSSPESLPPEVLVHALGATRVRTSFFRLLKLVRTTNPDVILSGIAHLNFLVLLLRPFYPSGTRVLVRQNGTVSSALAFGNLPWYTRLLYRLLYPHAHCVICQTRAMAEDMMREIGISRDRLAVLPNPVDVAAIHRSMAQESNAWKGPGPHLLAVGRLSREKGFDLLLQALDMIRQQFPDADLIIAGSGPEEANLKTQCGMLGIETNVLFVGQAPHPYAYFHGADVFVLSSRQEGLPNSLLEAASAGLPIVALPASAGIVDLLQEQPGTWLAPETSARALAASLLSALQTVHPGERFAHSFVEQFAMDRAIHAYEDLIDATVKEGRP